MCVYSIHAAHRKATEREDLTVRPVPGYGAFNGLYPREGNTDLLVCVKEGTKAVVDEVRFAPLMQGDMRTNWHGKKNVEVTLQRSGHHDVLMFPDGTVAPLLHIQLGVRIMIGMPVTQPGVDAVKAALVEQDKTTPTEVVRKALSTTKEAIRSRLRRARAKGELVDGD